MKDGLKMKGIWTVESENLLTGEVKVETYDNLIVQGFYDLVHRFLSFDQLAGVNADDMNITHLGMGLSSVAPVRADINMENEIERTGVTVKTFNSNEYILKFFLDSGVGNLPGDYITELGIFTKGTGSLGSGTLISRVITNIQKNVNIRLTLTWRLRGI